MMGFSHGPRGPFLLMVVVACMLQAKPAGAFLGPAMPLHRRACQGVQASRALPLRRLPLSRVCMSETEGEPKHGEGKGLGHKEPVQEEEVKKPDTAVKLAAASKIEDIELLDPTQRKFKAAALRKSAIDLDAEAQELHAQAIAKEKEAAMLRIEAWKVEGAVSAVSKQVIAGSVKNKYEKELAELDLMAGDWIDTDSEKWEWYQQQRQYILQMLDIQKENDELADQQLSELKETLLEMQEMFNIETVTEKGDITAAGWGFVTFSVVIPIWIGYTLFEWVFSTFSSLGGPPDPFVGL